MGEIDQQLGQLLVAYFERFSAKPACGLDLKLYLPSVGKDESDKFFTETLKLIDLDENNVPKTVSTACSFFILCLLSPFYSDPFYSKIIDNPL